MIRSPLFGFLGLNFGWGMVNLILTSKLAEHRIDDISTDGGMSNDWASIEKRFRAANYTAAGQRLLPWLIASSVGQLIALFAWVFLFAV
jgi:hypothetical protein